MKRRETGLEKHLRLSLSRWSAKLEKRYRVTSSFQLVRMGVPEGFIRYQVRIQVDGLRKNISMGRGAIRRRSRGSQSKWKMPTGPNSMPLLRQGLKRAFELEYRNTPEEYPSLIKKRKRKKRKS